VRFLRRSLLLLLAAVPLAGCAARAPHPLQTKPFDQPDEAMEFWLDQRLPPGEKDLPLERLLAASEEIRSREKLRAARVASTGWSSIGPGNVGGRTRALVVDPTNPQVLYAAGVSGGVWKSIDGGGSWSPTDDHMANLAVCTLAMDPTDSNVIYAGTGEGFSPGQFVRGLGIFKTVDGGATWTQLAATVAPAVGQGFYWVNEIVISPNDPSRLYAATRYGVWRSTDAGTSWTLVLANPTYVTGPSQTLGSSVGCTDIAVRTDRDPDVLFAAFGSFDSDGLFRSDDGGQTWLRYTTASYQGRMTIAIAPSNNDVIYLAMADNGGLNQLGRIVSVFKSVNGGASFTAVLDPSHPFSPWLMSYSSIATGCVQAPTIYSQGWYDSALAVDPVNPEIVWLGGIDLFRSDDGGHTFGMTGYWFYWAEDPVPPVYLHPDQHAIVFHPGYDGVSNQTLYVTNDGGLFRTDNARAATTQEECPVGPSPGPPPEIAWTTLNHGYGVTQFYHGDAAASAVMFAGGAQDNGTSSVTSTTTPNAWSKIFGGDGGYVAIDPGNPQRMFVEIQFFPEIHRSLDGGASFTKTVSGITDTDGLFITPFAMDQANPSVLWTGGARPWRTTDGAGFWSVAGPDFAGPGKISAIGIAPSSSSVVYLGFDNGYVARSTNALARPPAWQVQTTGLYGGWVSGIAVHPTDTNTAYLTYSTYGIPHVLRTTSGGQAWTPIDAGLPDIPAHWIAVRACDPLQLFVGTELGVFASRDGGTSWEPDNDGLAHTVVEALDFKDDDTLVAFTHGRGAFVRTLAPCGAGPGEARGLNAAYDRGTGRIDLTFTPACGATGHTIHSGPLSGVASYAYAAAACGIGASGSASFDPGASSAFFLVVGDDGALEGSYGAATAGPRPEDVGTPVCDLPRAAVAGCE